MPSSTTQEPKTPQKNELPGDDIKSKNPYSIEAILQNTATAGTVTKRKITDSDDITLPNNKKVKLEENSEEELKVEDDENDN